MSRFVPGPWRRTSRIHDLRVASRLQHNRYLVRHLALLLSTAGLVPGCFYVEPINQRPSLAIRATSDDPVYRGDRVVLAAEAADPDGHYIKFQWRAYACTDATAADACDGAPFYSELLETAAFDVPLVRADLAVPVEAIRVVLEARDELGATARPRQELVIPVLDRAPTLRLDKTSRYKYVTGTPIGVFALVGDADDGPDAVAPLVWEVFAPDQLGHTLVDRPVEQDPAQPELRHHGKTFTAMGPGDWQIRVTATDPLGEATSAMLPVTVMPDTPPCLAQLVPAVPTGGAALPLTAPTLFRVPVVTDDLDVYPPVASDEVLGTTAFRWSLQRPGDATHVPIVGATTNSYALDPAGFTPGDVLELRVEIFDRNAIAIPCVDGEPTCSVISEPTCIQRQTWRVEAR